jgi:SAM-dependent methyltransferase
MKNKKFKSVVNKILCPYCDGEARFFVSSTDANRHNTNAVFKYYQCLKCGLVFMHPIPMDMQPFYQGGYQKIPGTLEELRAIAADEKYRLEPILRYKSQGKLLEIGPWIGIFSCNAKDHGFDVTAIDIDQDCIDFLSRVVGVRAIQSADPAGTLTMMHERFDVIVLWHSLEHLPRPWLVVERAAERLAPGGVLLVAIPNIESYEYSLLKASWKHLDAPRHLYFYPVDSLRKLCLSNGLTELEVTTTDKLSQLLSRDVWHTWISSRILLRYLRRVLEPIIYKLIQKKQNSQNRGTGMTAIFQSGLMKPIANRCFK